MSIELWWSRIPRTSRAWLMENNGDAIPAAIVDEIVRAGGSITDSYLTDDAVDWVEAVANGEDPDPPIVRDDLR